MKLAKAILAILFAVSAGPLAAADAREMSIEH